MTAQPRSLVFLIPGFPADEQDTSCLPAMQNYVAQVAARWPALQVHVVAFQYPFARGVYRWKGVTVHAVGGRNRSGLRKLETWARAAAILLKLHRATRISALHSFWLSECAWIGQVLGRLLRIRHVASIGGQDARAGNPYFRLLALRRMTITAGSRFAAETFRAGTGIAVPHVIPLGLDTAHLLGIEPPPARDLHILGVGSLIPLKQYAVFIDLIADLREAYPDLRAVLIGEGTERAALERQIRERNLQRHLHLTGALPRDDVFRYMLRSHIFLHTAHYESQGYVFLEARLAGAYVVCFDVGHPGESRNVFPCSTPDEMREVLRQLLSCPPARPDPSVFDAADTVRAFEPLYFA